MRAATVTVLGLIVGGFAWSRFLLRSDSYEASRTESERQLVTAKLVDRLGSVQKSLAELAVRIDSIPHRLTPPSEVPPARPAFYAAGLREMRDRIRALGEAVHLRCHLVKKGGESLRDELFSSAYYRSCILDESASPRARAESFVLLSFLEHAEVYMLGLESRWVRDALLPMGLEVDSAMMMAAWALPRDAMVRTVLMDVARFSESERARENALIALANYEGDADVSRLVEGSARLDPSNSVRKAARKLAEKAIERGN